MCTIEPHILGVQAFGNVAVVFTLEVPRKGADQRDTKKAAPASPNTHHDLTQDPRPLHSPLPDLPMLLSKMFFPQLGSRSKQTASSSPEQSGPAATKSPSRILSMTTLRHTNQMWRIWSHHTTVIDSAAFLGNAVDIAALVREKHAVERDADAAANVSDDEFASPLQRQPRSMKDVMADVLSAVTQVASSMNPQPRTKHPSSSPAPFSVEVDSADDDDDDEMVDGGDVEGDEDVADFEPPHPRDYPLTRVVLDMIREANRQGYLSSEHREVLTDHLIHGLVTNQQSAVEVAYEVIFGYNLPSGMRRLSKSPLSPANAAVAAATLKSFADQCKRLASQLPLP